MHFTAEEENLLLKTAGFDPRSAEISQLKRKYEAFSTRYYHNWQHALNVLSWTLSDWPAFSPEARKALYQAALYHDAVYDELGSPYNESRSADLLPNEALLARHLIALTSQHGEFKPGEISEVGAYFLDCDMAAFLADPHWIVVMCRDLNIRKELCQLHEPGLVRSGRKKFLQKLYDNPHIFLTKHFQQEHERMARHRLWQLVYGPLYAKDK